MFDKTQINMKKTIFPLLIFALVAGVSSCKKDKEEEEELETPAAVTPSNPVPAPSDADGALVGVKTVTYMSNPFMGEIVTEMGVAVAMFGNLSDGTFVDAGSVSVNSKALTKQSNNSYVYTPSALDLTGIDYDDQPVWSIAGNSTVAGFEHEVNRSFPTNPNYNGSEKISTGASFELSSTVQLSADSVMFILAGPSNTVSKTLAGPASKVTFSADEMGSLGKGTGFLQLVPYNITSATINAKKYYFINESVFTKSVTFE